MPNYHGVFNVGLDAVALDNVIKSVVREHSWSPNEIGKLNLDDYDYTGLIYWYNDVKKSNEEIKNSYNKK